jgi:short-subunit dehydrogenase
VVATALCPGPVRTEFADTAGIGEEAEDLPGVFWADSPDVAEQGVRGLEKGRRVVVPGLLNRAGALGGQHAPRSVLLRLAGRFSPVGR